MGHLTDASPKLHRGCWFAPVAGLPKTVGFPEDGVDLGVINHILDPRGRMGRPGACGFGRGDTRVTSIQSVQGELDGRKI